MKHTFIVSIQTVLGIEEARRAVENALLAEIDYLSPVVMIPETRGHRAVNRDVPEAVLGDDFEPDATGHPR